MNVLAQELNQVLHNSAAGRMLSNFGKQIYFPKGIVAQAAEASSKAKRFDATIGMAVLNKEPLTLDVVRQQAPHLSPRELAAYAPTPGIPGVREGWKKMMLEKNPSLTGVKTSQPMVVAGLTNGIFHMADLFIEAGDDVVLPNLYWDNYELIFETRRGANLRTFQLFNNENGFNTKALHNLLDTMIRKEGKKKIIIVLNFPNNPSGYSPTKSEASEITTVLSEAASWGADILAVLDDAYYGLFYEDETQRESLFAPLATAHERIVALKIDGSTKEDFVWGFRLGFMTFAGKGLGDPELNALSQKLMGAIRSSVSNSSSPGQNLLLKAYAHPDYNAQKREAFELLKARYKLVRSIVSEYESKGKNGGLKALPFNSGYFMAFECTGLSPNNLRLSLLEKGIGSIALQDKYLRIAYSAVDIEALPDLFEAVYAEARSLGAT